jgi:hypothetical protein
MKNKSSNRPIVVVVISILVVCLIAEGINIVLDPFNDQERRYPGSGITLADYQEMGTFAVRSDTLLDSLSNNYGNAFQLSDPVPLVPEKKYQVLWRQQDYLKIANAAFNYKWEESPSSWSLYSMQFDTACQYSDVGFWRAFIVYYKSIWMGSSLKYTTREIDVYPWVGFVEWGAESSYPHPILGWSGIDLKRVKLPADDVLRVAEENGGKLARLAVGNKCDIHLNLYGSSTRGWVIYYYAEGHAAMSLQLCVNPYAGTIYKIPDGSIPSCE